MLSAAEATTKCKLLVDLVRGCQVLAQGTSSGMLQIHCDRSTLLLRDTGGTTQMRLQVQTMHTESMQELCNDASCDQFEASGQGGGIDFRV